MRVGVLERLVQNQVARFWSLCHAFKLLKRLVGERGFEPPTLVPNQISRLGEIW
jgi:hypothetical protein